MGRMCIVMEKEESSLTSKFEECMSKCPLLIWEEIVGGADLVMARAV